MTKEKELKYHGEKILAEWKAPEFRNLKKIKNYRFVSIFAFSLLAGWAVWNSNFLFLFILILGLFLIIFMSDYYPKNYFFAITDSGIWVDNQLYSFIEMDCFWVAPYATKKDRFLILHSPQRKELRLPVLIENFEKIRELINSYVPQTQHRVSLTDLIERSFL